MASRIIAISRIVQYTAQAPLLARSSKERSLEKQFVFLKRNLKFPTCS